MAAHMSVRGSAAHTVTSLRVSALGGTISTEEPRDSNIPLFRNIPQISLGFLL